MRRIRVAFVPSALQPGGAERQMLTLAERLPRERFEIDFLVLSGPGLYDERGKASGARVRTIGATPSPDLRSLERLRRRITKTTSFIRTVRSGRYDIVDAWLYPSDVLAALARPLTGTPIVISGRRNLDPHLTFGPLGRPIDRLAMRLTDVVVANSQAAADYASEREGVDPRKVRIIRNGVDANPELTPARRAAVRHDLGLEDHHLAIGCIANYLPIKRHDLLIEAFSKVAAVQPEARLVLVGEGQQRSAMESQVANLGLDDQVGLLGSIADPPAIIGAFDLVVQASRSEGLPNALLEAAAAGRPIVATAAGGSPEIVVDGVTGLLVPIDDVGALASAMLRLIDDDGLRTRLGAEARIHADTVFGMERFVDEFAALYTELASGLAGGG